MNYGYLNTDDKFLLLEPTDEPHRLFIQLYDFVVNDISLQDKDIIEVGCGRGGGGAS
ncbi:MAG: hypothetical protein REH83_02645 [Rickettsiella sp.]|nr:hypothetical protein [Rickettsiella sp.]